MLNEHYPLTWFSHLTFGRRVQGASGTYILPNPYSTSPEAIARVKLNLAELGKVITLMFSPRSWNKDALGTTYSDRPDDSRFREFRDQDLPPILSCEGRGRPIIALNACFQDFFRKQHERSTRSDEIYRAWFTFAITLGHEVAHAYEFWLTGVNDENIEPRWSRAEKQSELGYSWETAVLGLVPDPVKGTTEDWSRFPRLCALSLEEYGPESSREHLLKKFKGHTNAQFTTRDAAGRPREGPLLDPREFRGANWSLRRGSPAIVAMIHAVPLKWIFDWFQRDFWVRRKMEWARRGAYKAPRLDNAFMIIYERNAHNAQVHRPLNPSLKIDADILRQRAEKKAEAARAGMGH